MYVELTLKLNYKSAWVNSAIREWVCIWFACLMYKHLKCPHNPSFIPPIPTHPLTRNPWYPQLLPCLFRLFWKLPVELGQGEPQLNDDRANVEDWMLGLHCHVSRHWIQGSFEVNQLPLYHSTKLRANFCCCVTSVTCDLSVQHLFAVLLLLYHGRGETRGSVNGEMWGWFAECGESFELRTHCCMFPEL